mgnify:CR=1 FL=1
MKQSLRIESEEHGLRQLPSEEMRQELVINRDELQQNPLSAQRP